jgi:hypothetical protein
MVVKKAKRIKSSFKSMGEVLGKVDLKKDKYITREWQGYAVKLAEELNDREHMSLYMKMARDMDRSVLERARSFVRDADVDSKAKLFMWKVGQLRKERKNRETEKHKNKKSQDEETK